MALKVICSMGLFGVLFRAIPFWISWTFSCEYDRPSDRKKDKTLVHKSIKARLQIYQKQNTLSVYQLLYTYNITSKCWCVSSISRFPQKISTRFPSPTHKEIHQPPPTTVTQPPPCCRSGNRSWIRNASGSSAGEVGLDPLPTGRNSWRL